MHAKEQDSWNRVGPKVLISTSSLSTHKIVCDGARAKNKIKIKQTRPSQLANQRQVFGDAAHVHAAGSGLISHYAHIGATASVVFGETHGEHRDAVIIAL